LAAPAWRQIQCKRAVPLEEQTKKCLGFSEEQSKNISSSLGRKKIAKKKSQSGHEGIKSWHVMKLGAGTYEFHNCFSSLYLPAHSPYGVARTVS